MAEAHPDIVREFVNQAVVVHGGAPRRNVLVQIDAARAEGPQRRLADGPGEQVQDVAGLLDNVVPGAPGIEIPQGLARQVPGVPVALAEQHSAQPALLDELQRGAPVGIVPQLEARLVNPLGRFGRVDHYPAFLRSQRHGLLRVNVLAHLQRRDRDVLVRVHRRGDDHRIDVLALIQHLAEIREALRARNIDGLLKGLGNDVADCHHLHPGRLEHVPQQVGTPVAHADESHPHRVIRRLRRQQRGRPRHKTCERTTTVILHVHIVH